MNPRIPLLSAWLNVLRVSQETVEFIESRLAELDAEKDELQRYVELDKARRSLEYTILEKDLSETRQKLDDVEDRRRQAVEKARGKAVQVDTSGRPWVESTWLSTS